MLLLRMRLGCVAVVAVVGWFSVSEFAFSIKVDAGTANSTSGMEIRRPPSAMLQSVSTRVAGMALYVFSQRMQEGQGRQRDR
jgi:hypothetical protein